MTVVSLPLDPDAWRAETLARAPMRLKGKAAQRGHLTAAQAARLARTANVRALYLTHLSSRYEQAEIEAEARAVFPGAMVARDFDRITVRAAWGALGDRC